MDTMKRLDELLADHETTLFDLAKASDINYSTLHTAKKRGSHSVLIIRVFMPEPEETLNCRAVYFCFSRLSGSNFYATSELTEKKTFFLCGWGEDNTHINFGDAPVTPEAEMKKVAELFWEISSDGYWKKLKSVCSSKG